MRVWRIGWRRLFYATVCALLLPAAAGAQGLSQTIDSVRIEGNQRIEPETIRSYLTVTVGDPFDPVRIDSSLKALFDTGLFADVVISRESTALVVRVVENPVVNQITFEGNSSIAEEILRSEIQLRPRIVFTRGRVQSDVQRLLQIYQRVGMFAAVIDPKVVQLEQNRVDLIFEISEGVVTAVRRIGFVGNRAFDDRQLRGAIQSRETRWWRWLTANDTYDPDRLSFDQELLRTFYARRGYADFRVVSAVAELTPDGQDFFITFTVEEGQRYRFGALDVVSEVSEIDAESLRGLLQGEAGDTYDVRRVEDTVLDLTFELGRFGYAFVDIRPLLARDRENGTIDVTYRIIAGPRVHVGRINITGNTRTLDRVIRREFRIAEGDAFNTARVQRSVQRVRALGFFDRVDVTQEPADGASPDGLGVGDRIDLNMEVQERSTGDLVFGVGYSTVDKFVTDVTLTERNLLGRGQSLELAVTAASLRQQFDLSFTEPYFLDREISAGFDLFTVRNNLQSTSSYTESRRGFGLRAGFPLAERFRLVLRYGLQRRTVGNLAASASRFVADQRGSRLVSAVGYSLFYDRRNDTLFPTEGYAWRFGQELAGLGGDVRYARTTLSAQYHWPVTENIVASVATEEGWIKGLGQDVAITDRFFVGGNNLRGFSQAGIGPRDKATGDALGGALYYVATGEVSFPVGLPPDVGIRGFVFADVGSLGRLGFESPDVLDAEGPRASTGVGFSWISPLGPVRFDWSYPVRSQPFDLTETFRFSFGTRF